MKNKWYNIEQRALLKTLWQNQQFNSDKKEDLMNFYLFLSYVKEYEKDFFHVLRLL